LGKKTVGDGRGKHPPFYTSVAPLYGPGERQRKGADLICAARDELQATCSVMHAMPPCLREDASPQWSTKHRKSQILVVRASRGPSSTMRLVRVFSILIYAGLAISLSGGADVLLRFPGAPPPPALSEVLNTLTAPTETNVLSHGGGLPNPSLQDIASLHPRPRSHPIRHQIDRLRIRFNPTNAGGLYVFSMTEGMNVSGSLR
jgi:hypothetical protein